ncbi:MAG: alpha/beta hydrolase [Candidatus Ancillula sp.]|nr:alpha/beta hydrolase [Candidatus Ancillula sp.]
MEYKLDSLSSVSDYLDPPSSSTSKKLIVFLHGWMSNSELWRSTMESVAKSNHIFAFDFPGMGGSSEPESDSGWGVSEYTDLTVNTISKAIAKLQANNREIEEIVLVGHSFGGRVILKLIGDLSYSQKNKANSEYQFIKNHISKIVLVDSAGVRSRKPTVKQKLGSLKYKYFDKTFVKLINPKYFKQIQSNRSSVDYKAASEVMKPIFVKVINEDLEHCLSNIKIPTLLIWGQLDQDTPVSDGLLMEKKINEAGGDAALVVIKNSGHYSFANKSLGGDELAFIKILEAFL